MGLPPPWNRGFTTANSPIKGRLLVLTQGQEFLIFQQNHDLQQCLHSEGAEASISQGEFRVSRFRWRS